MIERPDKLNNHAIELASDGDFIGAIACFKRALTLEGDNSLLWYNLGITYRDSGDLDNAVNSFVKAYNLSPDNEEIIEVLATTYLHQNKYGAAKDYCFIGLELNEVNAHLWNLLGVINFKQEKYEDACEYFEAAVCINPYYEDAIFNLKDTYSELNNKTGVLECQKRLKELNK